MCFYQDLMVSNLKAVSQLRGALMYCLDQCPTYFKVLHVLYRYMIFNGFRFDL